MRKESSGGGGGGVTFLTYMYMQNITVLNFTKEQLLEVIARNQQSIFRG